MIFYVLTVRFYFATFKILFIMSTQSKVLLGILGAAAAGVVIGLLIAPEKGADMRKKIRKTAGDWADNLGNLWSHGKEAAEDGIADVKEKVKQAKSTAEGKMKESYS
jgi:gas vesicle protein